MSRSEEWISITEAAMLMKIRYQRARDLMIVGKLGETRTEGRFRFVKRSAVEEFMDEEEVA